MGLADQAVDRSHSGNGITGLGLGPVDRQGHRLHPTIRPLGLETHPPPVFANSPTTARAGPDRRTEALDPRLIVRGTCCHRPGFAFVQLYGIMPLSGWTGSNKSSCRNSSRLSRSRNYPGIWEH